jgi:hypothetical protein
VGAVVARGVGAVVVAGVGAGGASAGLVAEGDGVTAIAGDVAGLGTTPGGEAPGLGTGAGDGLAPDGVALPVGPMGGRPGDDVGPGVSGVVGPASGDVGVGIAAMAVARAEAAACCCNSTPPIPRAIVARTRFRTPRLRMSRTR